MMISEKVRRKIEEIKSHIFLDPTIDIVFKKLFAVDRILIHFLNAILHLPDEERIVSLQPQKKAIRLSSDEGEEEVRFDLHAKLNSGKFIDLEMQRARHTDFLDRVKLYASQLSVNSKITFDSERTAKEKEKHPYLMPQTISVWLCNFNVPFCKTYREELGLFRHSDIGKEGAIATYDKKKYIIIDLTKYESGGAPQEAEWLYLFTHVANAKAEPTTTDGTIADAYNRLKVTETSEEFIKEVAQFMVTKEEILTRINDARVEIGRKMFKKGYSLKEIISVTGLSEEEILSKEEYYE